MSDDLMALAAAAGVWNPAPTKARILRAVAHEPRATETAAGAESPHAPAAPTPSAPASARSGGPYEGRNRTPGRSALTPARPAVDQSRSAAAERTDAAAPRAVPAMTTRATDGARPRPARVAPPAPMEAAPQDRQRSGRGSRPADSLPVRTRCAGAALLQCALLAAGGYIAGAAASDNGPAIRWSVFVAAFCGGLALLRRSR